MRPFVRLAAGAAAILAATSGARVGADDERYAAQRCVYVERIDQTRIVDERSILFFMRDRTVLQNVLPNACHGLRNTDPIKYDVVAGKLCAGEFVTQLIDSSTYGPGRLCKIGMFVPIDREEAQRLLPSRRRQPDHSLTQDAIESKSVALPPAAPEQAAEPAATRRTSGEVEPAPAPKTP